jgi:hypothetical protein
MPSKISVSLKNPEILISETRSLTVIKGSLIWVNKDFKKSVSKITAADSSYSEELGSDWSLGLRVVAALPLLSCSSITL